MNCNVHINVIHTSLHYPRKQKTAKRGFHSQRKLIRDCPAIRKHRLALCKQGHNVCPGLCPFGGSLISGWPKPVMKPQPCMLSLVLGFYCIDKIGGPLLKPSRTRCGIASLFKEKNEKEKLPQGNKCPLAISDKTG